MDWNTVLLAFINSWAIPSLSLMVMVFAMTGVTRRRNFLNHDRELKRDSLEDSRRRFEISNDHALALSASREQHQRTNLAHQYQHEQRMAEIKQQNTALTAEVKAQIDKAIAEYKTAEYRTKDGKGSPNLDDHRPVENGVYDRL